MYRSESCLPFFSSVVKNVANPNIEVKKLVHIYLLHHAESEPDLALLSINTIQKSLTDQNPQVRAMSLRTMSGIRVPVISQIVSLAIKRGCGDMSPHVRKAAALAIPKCYRLDPNTMPQLLEYLSALLGDSQYFVVGPAVSAFLEICPDRIDLIHKHYRSLVKKLVDMDEWGQLATLRLLATYSRRCFPRRKQIVAKARSEDFYEESSSGEGEEVEALDPDLELFFKACRPLLQSRNSAVIVSVVRCYLYLGTAEYLKSAIGSLIALLRGPQDVQIIVLYNIIRVALVTPSSFLKYISHFLIRSSDPHQIWTLKLEVLTLLFPHCGMHMKGVILSELEHFSNGTNLDLVRESVRAIGRCAQSDNRTSLRCLRLLLRQISSSDENLVSEALTVIRHLIQQDPASHKGTVVMLSKHLDTTTSPEARASIIWLVGEFAGIDFGNNIAPDILRILAKGFADESEPAKQQIVLLGAKVYLHHLLQRSAAGEDKAKNEDTKSESKNHESPSTVNGDDTTEDELTILWRYILLLARYDTSYDLRDRARLYKSLLAVPSSTQLGSLLLLAPKPVPYTPTPSETRKDLLLGSSTLVIGPNAGIHGLKGYEDLPDWVELGQEPDPKLRDNGMIKGDYYAASADKQAVTAGEMLDRALQEQASRTKYSNNGTPVSGTAKRVINSNNSNNNKDKSLDDWLAEEEEEESVEEVEGSTEEESTEESEYEEEDSEDSGDNEENDSESENDDNENERAGLIQ